MKLGVLNPGAMGVSVGAALVSNGHEVFWLAEGRSPATRERAEQHGLIAVSTMTELVDSVAGIVSVCPPHGALELAEQVMAAGFEGIYLDGNAVSPETARNIHALVGETFVDGGIVGPPALRAGTTRLYLSGQRAAEAQEWFTGSNLVAELVVGAPGAASALKMCYAAYTKGTSALLLAIRALAVAEGVDESLIFEWGISQPELARRSEGAARGSAPKAWRFVGEMEEIAAAFAAQGLPDGFHLAAADVYGRLEAFKDRGDCELSEVLAALQK